MTPDELTGVTTRSDLKVGVRHQVQTEVIPLGLASQSS
jgi:hypothetical protein